MLNKLLSLVLKLVLGLLRFILNIVLLPLTSIVNLLFPDVGNYISSFYTLLNNYLFNGLRFAREVIFNLSGINRNLVAIAVAIPLTYLTFSLANASIRFLVSIYRMYKTGREE